MNSNHEYILSYRTMENPRIQCDKCEKTFARKNAYYTHNKSVHEGIIQFCKSCPKSFSTPAGLWLHEKTKHEGKIYKCVHCNKEFSSNSGYLTHNKTIHLEQIFFEPLKSPKYLEKSFTTTY